MMYIIEMASCGMVYMPRFVKTVAEIEALLRFCQQITQDSLLLLLLLLLL
jgi:hypothetical protein